jgi:hypothetical protein
MILNAGNRRVAMAESKPTFLMSISDDFCKNGPPFLNLKTLSIFSAALIFRAKKGGDKQ